MKVLSDPERLGKYLIQGVLGEGGMGVVYKGYDPQLARPVAIKTIRRSLLMGKAGQELKKRFNREAQAEGSLVHPNIVTVYEYQEDEGGTPFFVMEYVEGKSLKEYLARGIHFNLEMSLHIITQVLDALAYTHKRGVIHRDIKPANILWLEDDSVKIADFGIAKMEESELTRSGQVMGTPQYFSPEQAAGLKTDSRSDLYSTALVLYELMAGVKPFAGQSGADKGLVDRHLEKLDLGDADLLNPFKAIIRKALEKDPANRFQTAEEFAAALRRLPTGTREPPPLTRVTVVGGGKRWLGLGGVLGVLALALAYFLPPTAVDVLDPLPPPGEGGKTAGDERAAAGNEAASPAFDRAPGDFASRPAAETTVLSTQDKAKLQRLLNAGRIHLMVGRLITPQGSNAFHSYKLALEIDPGNREAQSGMASIQDKVVSHSRHLLDGGKPGDARDHLAVAVRLFPGNRELRTLLQESERRQ